MSLHCPICNEAVASDGNVFPFCSERCRLIDLGGWLGERYRVRGNDEDDVQSAEAPPSDED